MKICTFNVKFGLFWVCSVTLRQFVWILRKSGWLLCISMHMQQLWGDGSVDQGNLESSTLNEGWRKILVTKLCKFGEILKLLHLVLMLWNWHHCWMMRSVRKCWPYMHDFVHKPMGIYLVVWYLKGSFSECQPIFYGWPKGHHLILFASYMLVWNAIVWECL